MVCAQTRVFRRLVVVVRQIEFTPCLHWHLESSNPIKSPEKDSRHMMTFDSQAGEGTPILGWNNPTPLWR